MKPILSDSLLAEQLRFLMPRVLIGDAAIILLCLPLYGLDAGIIFGLLLGTAAMLVNMALLSYSVRHAVDRGSEKSAKRYMLSFYMIRFAIMGMYKSKIAQEISEPRIIPIDKNKNNVAEYIG